MGKRLFCSLRSDSFSPFLPHFPGDCVLVSDLVWWDFIPVETDFADWDLDTLSPADNSSLSLLFAEETRRHCYKQSPNWSLSEAISVLIFIQWEFIWPKSFTLKQQNPSWCGSLAWCSLHHWSTTRYIMGTKWTTSACLWGCTSSRSSQDWLLWPISCLNSVKNSLMRTFCPNAFFINWLHLLQSAEQMTHYFHTFYFTLSCTY